MIGYEIEHHLEAEVVCARKQRAEIGQRSEQWIDIEVVRDVITEVDHGHGKIGEIQIASTPSLDQISELGGPRRSPMSSLFAS
jgi:hypothetical protein